MAPPHKRYEIPPFVFDAESGELTRTGQVPVRLQPQPARLLALLAERSGEVVTHAEIQQAVWPDTRVDYEQGVRFCIRQIRAALEDSASEPRFLETLPRRGYRLRPVPLDGSPEPPEKARPIGGRYQLMTWGVAALVLPLVAAAALFLGLRPKDAVLVASPEQVGDTSLVAPAPRVAVMPFGEAAPEHGVELAPLFEDISQHLVAAFAADGLERVEVIGPSTTHAYLGSRFPQLDRLREELDAQYVINAFALGDAAASAQTELLIELIRLDDGAHPWVDSFGLDEVEDPARVAGAIEEAVRAILSAHHGLDFGQGS